jgi:hypothetical protein
MGKGQDWNSSLTVPCQLQGKDGHVDIRTVIYIIYVHAHPQNVDITFRYPHPHHCFLSSFIPLLWLLFAIRK